MLLQELHVTGHRWRKVAILHIPSLPRAWHSRSRASLHIKVWSWQAPHVFSHPYWTTDSEHLDDISLQIWPNESAQGGSIRSLSISQEVHDRGHKKRIKVLSHRPRAWYCPQLECPSVQLKLSVNIWTPLKLRNLLVAFYVESKSVDWNKTNSFTLRLQFILKSTKCSFFHITCSCF